MYENQAADGSDRRIRGSGNTQIRCSIGVIGDYDSICGFAAMGFSVRSVTSAEQARKDLKALADSGYGIIYITEPLMEEIKEDCARYDEHATPCIVPIPSVMGATGLGERRLRHFVEQAVGSDIIFR